MLNVNLKKYRRACGYNQEDVASVIGVDRSAYSYYESGKTEPSIKNLIKIARMFNVDVDTLIGNNEHTSCIMVANNAVGYNNEKFDKNENLGRCSSQEKALIAWLRQLDNKDEVIELIKQQYFSQGE